MSVSRLAQCNLLRLCVGAKISFLVKNALTNKLNSVVRWLGAMALPVPISNTVVKHGSGDDTP